MGRRASSARHALPCLSQIAQFANTFTGFTTSEDVDQILVADRLGAIWRLDDG